MEDINVKYKRALKEAYIIINNFPENLYVKIPISFKKALKENMDSDYDITFDKLKTNGQMQETIDLISLIYRDYLCNTETKNELISEDEKILHDKYFNMFNKNATTKEQLKLDKNLTPIIIKEKWYLKVYRKIKKLFFNK